MSGQQLQVLTPAKGEILAQALLARIAKTQAELRLQRYSLNFAKWSVRGAILVCGVLGGLLAGKDGVVLGFDMSSQVVALLTSALVVIEAWDMADKLPYVERFSMELIVIEQQVRGELDRAGTSGLNADVVQAADNDLTDTITRWADLL
jgi:hypothetical protein